MPLGIYSCWILWRIPIPTVPNHVPWKPPCLGDAKNHFKLPDVHLAQRRDATEGESDLFLWTQTCSASFHRWHWAAPLQRQLESERKVIQSARMKAVIKGCLLHNAPPLKAPTKRCFHSRYFNIPITSLNYFASRFGRQCWIMFTKLNRKIRKLDNILKRVFSDVFLSLVKSERILCTTVLYNWFTLVLLSFLWFGGILRDFVTSHWKLIWLICAVAFEMMAGEVLLKHFLLIYVSAAGEETKSGLKADFKYWKGETSLALMHLSAAAHPFLQRKHLAQYLWGPLWVWWYCNQTLQPRYKIGFRSWHLSWSLAASEARRRLFSYGQLQEKLHPRRVKAQITCMCD